MRHMYGEYFHWCVLHHLYRRFIDSEIFFQSDYIRRDTHKSLLSSTTYVMLKKTNQPTGYLRHGSKVRNIEK